MLALLDSLLAAGFDPSDQAQRALAWLHGGQYRPGEVFDIGITTRRALDRARRGVPPEACGGGAETDNGNGSLMRILPVALVEREVPDAVLVDHAMRASALTHAHARARLTCALYSLLVRRLLDGAPPPDALGQALSLLENLAPDALGTELRLVLDYGGRTGSGYVVDTFWSAVDAVVTARGYEEAVKAAVAFGNDTDTTAAVAGGLAGATWGAEAIPAAWVNGMRGREVVEALVGRLLDPA